MKPRWKVFIGILLWIALAGIIHYTRISWLKESPNWSESSPDDSIRSYVLSFTLILSYPGVLISSYLPLLRGRPMDLDGFSTFAEIFDDILYAFVIAFVFLKLRLKHKLG